MSVVTNEFGTVIENVTTDPFGAPLTGGSTTRFSYEGKEFSALTGQYDFSFRMYDPNTKLHGIPDPLISNFYNPQTLNRYAFEENDPINNVDPSGHCPQCIAASFGFVIGSFQYMLTHSGSGWSHVANTYAAGTITAASFAGSAGLAVSGGRAVAGSGAGALLRTGGNILIGASGEAASEALDGEDLDPISIGIAGAVSAPSYFLGLKPGSYVGKSNIWSKNNMKLVAQQIAGQDAGLAIETFVYPGISNQKTSDNSNKASSGSLTPPSNQPPVQSKPSVHPSKPPANNPFLPQKPPVCYCTPKK